MKKVKQIKVQVTAVNEQTPEQESAVIFYDIDQTEDIIYRKISKLHAKLTTLANLKDDLRRRREHLQSE